MVKFCVRYVDLWGSRYRKGVILIRSLWPLQIACGVIIGSVLGILGLWGLVPILLIIGRKRLLLLSITALTMSVYTTGYIPQAALAERDGGEGLVEVVNFRNTFDRELVVLLNTGERAVLPLTGNIKVGMGDWIDFKGPLQHVSQAYTSSSFARAQQAIGISWVGSGEIVIVRRKEGCNAFLATAERLKAGIRDMVHRRVNFPTSGLILGVVTGDDSDLLPVQASFRAAGLSHVTAVSGFNVMLVISACGAAAGILPRRLVWLITLVFAWAYGAIVGLHTLPALRAVIMASLSLVSRLYGRPLPVLLALVYTVAIMLLLHPLLWWSVSFQLSLCALMGVVIFAPLLQSFLSWCPELVRVELIATCAATLLTLPVAAVWFGEISVVGVFTNLIGLPLIALINTSVYAAILLGVIWFVSDKLFILSELAGRTLIVFVEQVGSWPIATLSTPQPLLVVLAVVGILVVCDFWQVRIKHHV